MAPDAGFLYFDSMKMLQALLVNPPIFDFTAYDFWLRPYGMLRVAGQMQGTCKLDFFDYLISQRQDEWARGRFHYQYIPKPRPLEDIPRRFRRFGRLREEFREFLRKQSYDVVLIQTMMTYWYLGVREVIEDVRKLQPWAKIVLGGVYASLCPSHALSLGADLVIEGDNLDPLWQLLVMKPGKALPYWPSELGMVGVIKLTQGCPFRCTYCSVPLLWPEFKERPTTECLEELQQLVHRGARHIAFYDDALLFHADRILIPFLQGTISSKAKVLFHTPNALNARFISAELAKLMVLAGFGSFFLGLESSSVSWQKATGGKVYSEEFLLAVENLRAAGAASILTYIILGHPDSDEQELELSIRFAHACGTKVLLSEFSPVPGTTDGKKSEKWADLDEPLSHNKTAFAFRRLGRDYVNQIKKLAHSLNSQLPAEQGGKTSFINC